jgi:hypothetical protein
MRGFMMDDLPGSLDGMQGVGIDRLVLETSRLPLGGVERPGRKERFARLIHRPVRVLGVPSARAAYGGNLNVA